MSNIVVNTIFILISSVVTVSVGFTLSHLPITTTSPLSPHHQHRRHSLPLSMSMKPAAIPLLSSGKSLAVSGELLISFTSTIGLYGGALSSAGADIRNAGDCLAQAAASSRFKTGYELVMDELRESGYCLSESSDKLRRAVGEMRLEAEKTKGGEAKEGGDEMLLRDDFVLRLEDAVLSMKECGRSLESAGECMMKRKPVADVGRAFLDGADHLEVVADVFRILAKKKDDSDDNDSSSGMNDDDMSSYFEDMLTSSEKMAFAATMMKEAGNNLQSGGEQKKKIKGKGWIKGGF